MTIEGIGTRAAGNGSVSHGPSRTHHGPAKVRVAAATADKVRVAATTAAKNRVSISHTAHNHAAKDQHTASPSSKGAQPNKTVGSRVDIKA